MGGCYQEESEICKLETILLGVGGAILGVGAIVGIVIAGVVCVGAATTASVATYNWVHTGNFDLKNPLYEPDTQVVQNQAYGRKSLFPQKKGDQKIELQ